ncbi:MAG: hypothetical protein KC933_17120 [Myxococcales bacterium]|nr:hypothetical protein [Myxococcales bacterium]
MAERDTFTALDWIAAVLAGLVALGLFLFPVIVIPPWRSMLAELGGAVPGLTQLALTPWFAPAHGLVAVVLLGMGARGRLTRRRAAVVAAFFWGAAALAANITALYLPIFQLSGTIER